MKKIINLISLGMAVLLCFSSCQVKEKGDELPERTVTPVRRDYDGRHANSTMLKLWEALESKDREGIKELLSKEAVEEIEDCDVKIDVLIDFFPENVTECKFYLLNSSTDRHKGKVQYVIEGGYELITAGDTYLLTFSMVTRDDYNGDRKGVYRIDMLTLERSDSKGWGGTVPDICVYTNIDE